MPKVKDAYRQEKRQLIMDAAHRVCLQKPAYALTMRDIISEIGWSQGAIYRYFKNIHEILFELINRQTAHLHVKDEIDAILSLPLAPEEMISRILDIVTHTSMMNIKKFGKMLFEYSAWIAQQPELLLSVNQKVNIVADFQYLQKRALEYILLQLENGYFKPLLPIKDIFAFVGTSIDGIQRDLIFVQCYQLNINTPTLSNHLEPQKLMKVLCQSTLYLLGVEPQKKNSVDGQTLPTKNKKATI